MKQPDNLIFTYLKSVEFKVHPLDQNIRNDLSISKVPVSQGFYIYENEDYANNFWKQHIDESKHEQYKQYRKEWHRRPQFNDFGNMPLSVIIELNSGCNLSCNMFTQSLILSKFCDW